eukprot:scaffold271856_cov40-Attheya_sp.AAC.1
MMCSRLYGRERGYNPTNAYNRTYCRGSSLLTKVSMCDIQRRTQISCPMERSWNGHGNGTVSLQ